MSRDPKTGRFTRVEPKGMPVVPAVEPISEVPTPKASLKLCDDLGPIIVSVIALASLVAIAALIYAFWGAL
jgi:hypothetical protein